LIGSLDEYFVIHAGGEPSDLNVKNNKLKIKIMIKLM